MNGDSIKHMENAWKRGGMMHGYKTSTISNDIKVNELVPILSA